MSNIDFPYWMPSELRKDRPDISKVRVQILNAYELETGIRLNQPPSESELNLVYRWINKNYETFLPAFVRPYQISRQVYSSSLSQKVISLAQHHCVLCTAGKDESPTYVMSVRIPPISKQAAARTKGRRAAFERAIRHRFSETATLFPEDMSVCLLIIFVTKATGAQKDLDNMAKALLDAIKNVLFGDDKRIDHLNIIRIKSTGEEFIHINIRESSINAHEDVFLPEMRHSWGGAKALDLEDFMAVE